MYFVFFFNDTATTEIYTLSLPDALPICIDLGTTNSVIAVLEGGEPTVVANAVTFNIPAGIPRGEWFWVPLPASTFTYNGTDNLIVDVLVTAGSTDTRLRISAVTGRRVFSADNTALDGQVNNVAYHIKLRFNGGTMGVITDAAVGTSNVFPGASAGGIGGRVNLYSATELGTAAQITSVACRMEAATSTATTLNNYKVIMGHTTLNSLDTTAANNFISQQIVYDGSFDILAGLVQGDWITVPLTTPFNYNGTDNLVIWMGTTAASGGITHRCELSSLDAIRYSSHTGTNPPDSINIGTDNRKFDLRLEMTK